MVDSLLRRLVLSALALAAAMPVAAAPPIVTTTVVPFDGEPAAELLAAVNDARHEAGLQPLVAEPALAKVAAQRAAAVAAGASFDADADTVMAMSRELRRAGYPPYAWRQRLVQGPRDAAALMKQWREADPASFGEIVLGDFESFGAAVAPGTDPPLWSLFVALPRITWERRISAPLDDLAAMRAGVLSALNRERKTRGLVPLVIDGRLDEAAQAHAADMLARRYYDHTSPEGRGLDWRFTGAGYHFRWAAENIAKGVFDPDEVVRRWMLSSGHRRNILDPHPVHVGIGVARGEESGEVTALWVLDFGAPV
ncbi:MAG TPA: CAP domain-containing protein [Thermoanaerobaculia bacterium]|nr:CAP domain-containing protein [Thermoanaerobaculia bacterium]